MIGYQGSELLEFFIPRLTKQNTLRTQVQTSAFPFALGGGENDDEKKKSGGNFFLIFWG